MPCQVMTAKAGMTVVIAAFAGMTYSRCAVVSLTQLNEPLLPSITGYRLIIEEVQHAVTYIRYLRDFHEWHRDPGQTKWPRSHGLRYECLSPHEYAANGAGNSINGRI